MKKKHIDNMINEENVQSVQSVEEENTQPVEIEEGGDEIELNDVKVDKAFPVSKRTKRDQSKTSVVFTVLSIVLYVLAYLPIVLVSLVLAIKTYNLMPYYTFWPFVGVILAGILGLVFMTITLVVTRKKSKKSIRSQTVRTLIAYVCLTCGFGLILTYVFPDVISMATQGTLKCEDLYYNGESQVEHNAKLERDFITYNILNGNLNEFDEQGNLLKDYSYTTLSKQVSGGTAVKGQYVNTVVNERYQDYYKQTQAQLDNTVAEVKKAKPLKGELYDFIYTNYILNDYDYAFNNTKERRALCLAITDYIYNTNEFRQEGGYENLLKAGFDNHRVKRLFVENYNSFNHDGYLTFDDPLLLYAQMNGRMGVPVILRLILNEGWSYTQGAYIDGSLVYGETDNNLLYQLYDKELVEEYVKSVEEGTDPFPYEGTIINQDNKAVTVKYGYNKDGWMMYANGYTKRPINWLVLDMLGDPMALGEIDNALVNTIFNALDKFDVVEALGGLIQVDLQDVLDVATNGSTLNIGLCINDEGKMEINLFSMNAPYGMLGYMQATWVESDNLLMAVVNVVALRNWFSVLGAVGAVFIIMAGVLRDLGEKTRKRTEDSRDRIMLAKELADNEEGDGIPPEPQEPQEAIA